MSLRQFKCIKRYSKALTRTWVNMLAGQRILLDAYAMECIRIVYNEFMWFRRKYYLQVEFEAIQAQFIFIYIYSAKLFTICCI